MAKRSCDKKNRALPPPLFYKKKQNAGLMNWFATRRLHNLVILIITLLVLAYWVRWQKLTLRHDTFTTGYLLISMVGFLALYNLRKKITMLPIGTSASWLQFHIYVGLASIFLFGMHLSWHLPNGIMDVTLALIYSLTAASGVYGIYITRKYPKQLARVGEEVIYERIPYFRHQIKAEAEEVMLRAISTSGVTTLADFYTENIAMYLAHPRGLRYYLWPSTALRRLLLDKLTDLRRYLSDDERICCEHLFALVRKKDDLDFHSARQSLLKIWLFVHITLTYMLVILATVHAITAHAFHGRL